MWLHAAWLWPPYGIGQAIIFSSCGFYLLSYFSSPYLNGRILDVYHTSTHGLSLGLKRAVRGSLKIQHAKIAKKSPSGHHPTTLSGYIFTIKAHIDNRKYLLSANISLIRPDNMVNFGPLAAEIDLVVWGTLQISTRFASCQPYCTALEYWALVDEIEQFWGRSQAWPMGGA